MNVIDMFSGCGGLSKGFLDAGFNVLLGVDNDLAALETFRLNHVGANGQKIDLFKNDAIEQMASFVDGKKVDVIVAGPPCQGFSVTGQKSYIYESSMLYSILNRRRLSLRMFVVWPPYTKGRLRMQS